LGSNLGVVHIADCVEEIEVLDRVLLQTTNQDLFAVMHNDVEELGDGDGVAGLEELRDGDAGLFVDEIGGGFGLGADALELALVFEVILITALAPVGEVLVTDAFGVRAEVFEDGWVISAIIEQMVDPLADGFGKLGDFAGALSARDGFLVKGG
jgi:hypothetical protein